MVKPQTRRKTRNEKLPLFSSRKSPPPAPWGHFCFRPLILLDFSVSIIPQNCLEFPLLSHLVGYPLERIFRQKMKAVALYFYKHYICFGSKLRKIFLFTLIQYLIAIYSTDLFTRCQLQKRLRVKSVIHQSMKIPQPNKRGGFRRRQSQCLTIIVSDEICFFDTRTGEFLNFVAGRLESLVRD